MKKTIAIFLIIIMAVLVTTTAIMAKPEKVVVDEKNISGKTVNELKNEFMKISDERDTLLIDRLNNYNGNSDIYPNQDRLNELDELYIQYDKNIKKQEIRNRLEQGELQVWEEELQFKLKYQSTPELDSDGRKQFEYKTALLLLQKLKESMKDNKKSDTDLYKEYEIFKQAFRASDKIYNSGASNPKSDGEKLVEKISNPKYTIFDFAKEFDIQIDKL